MPIPSFPVPSEWLASRTLSSLISTYHETHACHSRGKTAAANAMHLTFAGIVILLIIQRVDAIILSKIRKMACAIW